MFLNTDSKFIWLNGSFQPFNQTNIHLLTNTLHYGMGVFEGVRAYETSNGGAIFRLDDHTKRLFDAASKINISKMEACLNYSNSFNEINKIIVGIDNLSQFKEILSYDLSKDYQRLQSFNCLDKALINPTNWDSL